MILLLVEGNLLGAYVMIKLGMNLYPDFEFDEIALPFVMKIGKAKEIVPGETAFVLDRKGLANLIEYCQYRYLREAGRKYCSREYYYLRFRRCRPASLGLVFSPPNKQVFRLYFGRKGD